MHNNKNLIVVLIGGFLIASVVAILVQVALKSTKKEPPKIEMTKILVAAKDLTVGDEIVDGDMKWQNWPKDAIFAGAIQRKPKQEANDAVEGKLVRSLTEGQPVSRNVVTKEDSGQFLSASLTQGMRAISISVRSYKLADRLIRPGDYVDLLVTYRVRVNSRNNPEAASIINRYATETVLENVKVLAVDKNSKTAVDEEDENGKKKKSKKKSSKKATVTLELTSEGVEKLVLAEKVGDVDLALRSMGDNKAIAGQKVTTDVEMSRVLTELSSMQGTTSGVRVYNGAEMNEVRGRQVKKASDIDYNVDPVSDDDKTTKQLLREILTEDAPSESEEE